MKALTVTQPWATLIILGVKHFETRSWFPSPADRRGRIVIHAGKGWRREDREFADLLHERGTLPVRREDLPLGAALGTVRFDGLARTTTVLPWEEMTALELYLGDYSPGRYAWLFGDPLPFPEPILVRGALGLWHWPDKP